MLKLKEDGCGFGQLCRYAKETTMSYNLIQSNKTKSGITSPKAKSSNRAHFKIRYWRCMPNATSQVTYLYQFCSHASNPTLLVKVRWVLGPWFVQESDNTKALIEQPKRYRILRTWEMLPFVSRRKLWFLNMRFLIANSNQIISLSKFVPSMSIQTIRFWFLTCTTLKTHNGRARLSAPCKSGHAKPTIDLTCQTVSPRAPIRVMV